MLPIVGITADADDTTWRLGRAYGDMVTRAGGAPIVLPARPECVPDYLGVCDAIILSGGDCPAMEPWGIDTHPEATAIDTDRQAFELALLGALETRPDVPVLGICLGMQMMCLHAGGSLDQWLEDSVPTAADHWDHGVHPIEGDLGSGIVHSHHRQAITDAGSLRVIAVAPDGVIEAVRDEDRAFYVGVQWHPERTEDDRLGFHIVNRLVHAKRRNAETPTSEGDAASSSLGIASIP